MDDRSSQSGALLPEIVHPTNSYIPKKGLSPRHREIMRRVAVGERQCDIAADMHLSERALSIIVNSPLFQAELEKMMEKIDQTVYDAMGELVKLQPDAVEAIQSSITQTDLPVLRFNAARDLLNRTGVNVPKEYHVTKDQRSYEELLTQVRIKYQHDEVTKRLPEDEEEEED